MRKKVSIDRQLLLRTAIANNHNKRNKSRINTKPKAMPTLSEAIDEMNESFGRLCEVVPEEELLKIVESLVIQLRGLRLGWSGHPASGPAVGPIGGLPIRAGSSVATRSTQWSVNTTSLWRLCVLTPISRLFGRNAVPTVTQRMSNMLTQSSPSMQMSCNEDNGMLDISDSTPESLQLHVTSPKVLVVYEEDSHSWPSIESKCSSTDPKAPPPSPSSLNEITQKHYKPI